MKKRAFFAVCFLLSFLLVLGGCGKKHDGTKEILYELMAVSGERNEYGELYFLGAAEGELGYFSREQQSLLYGEKAAELSFDGLRGCAVFISAREMCELAVFECSSRYYTEEIYDMLCQRADMIKIALAESEEYKEKSQNIKVAIHGRYVLFAFAENTDAVEKKLEDIC